MDNVMCRGHVSGQPGSGSRIQVRQHGISRPTSI